MIKIIMSAPVTFYPHRADDRLRAVIRAVGWAAVILLLVLVTLVFPVLVVVGVILFIGFSFQSKAVTASVATAVMLGIFGWMNSMKGISNDWSWYTQHYLMLKWMPFNEYWGAQIGIFSIKITEPVYYFISSVTAKLTDGNIPVLAWVISALIYILLGASVGLFSARMAKMPAHVGVSVLAALMVGVTFTLTTQLVRQEIANAFLVSGFVFFYLGKRAIGILLATLAIFTHNSAVAPVAAVIAVHLFAFSHGRPAWGRVALLWLGFLALGLAFLFAGPGGDYLDSAKSDGVISTIVIVMDVVFLLVLLFLRSRLGASQGELQHFLNILAVASIVYSGFLIGVSPAPLPLLRMYFYVEMFRTLMVTAIVCSLLNTRYGSILAFPILLAAIVYVEMRIAVSHFWFGGGGSSPTCSHQSSFLIDSGARNERSKAPGSSMRHHDLLQPQGKNLRLSKCN